MDDIPDVKHHQVGGPGVVEQAECRQLPEIRSWTKTIGTDGSVVVDDHDQFDSQGGVDRGRGEDDDAVNHPPVMRSKRTRKPNSKYDPAVYDLDSVKIRRIPLERKKNGWMGIYWPE